MGIGFNIKSLLLNWDKKHKKCRLRGILTG